MPSIRTHFGALTPDFKCIDELVCTDPVEENMNTKNTFSLIEFWVRRCSPDKPEHFRCHRHMQLATETVASRLIDIMSGRTRDRVRLTVSSEEREAKPYMTLSYHWGPNVNQDTLPLLRISSLEAYRKKIPLFNMPKLFTEFIELARRLGVRYVWIDAYCIVQDAVVDWQTECAKMGDIYQQALLNIAAGGAHDSNAHLMIERNVAQVEPCRISVDWRNLATNMKRADGAFCPIGSYYVFDSKYTQHQMLETPLNRRAWVMQEQQLSPRILHFGKHQLFWHCWGDLGQSLACETLPTGMPIMLAFMRTHQYGLQTALSLEYLDAHHVNPQAQWNLLVMAYSRCEITKVSDRLVAISGLAQKFAAILECSEKDYAAGLWNDGALVISLCWHADNSSSTPSPRSYRYREEFVAPSWSWASINGHVVLLDPITARAYEMENMQLLELCVGFQITIKHCQPENPYGSVSEGRLRCSGYIIPGDNLIWFWNLRKDAQRGQRLNCVICMTLPLGPYLSCNFDDFSDYTTRKRRWLGLPVFYRAAGIDLLPLAYWKHPTKPRQSFIEGLMIVRDVDTDCYRRIGYFSSDDTMYKYKLSRAEYLLHHMQKNNNIVLI